MSARVRHGSVRRNLVGFTSASESSIRRDVESDLVRTCEAGCAPPRSVWGPGTVEKVSSASDPFHPFPPMRLISLCPATPYFSLYHAFLFPCFPFSLVGEGYG